MFGEKQVSRELLRVSDAVQDARPAFRKIADDLVQAGRRQFDTQGGHASGRWAPLKPETVRAKASKGHDPRILRATEALMNSLSRRGGPGQKLQITPGLLVFGSDVDYGRYHQSGTSRMPQRRPLELTAVDRRGVMRRLQRFVMTGEA